MNVLIALLLACASLAPLPTPALGPDIAAPSLSWPAAPLLVRIVGGEGCWDEPSAVEGGIERICGPLAGHLESV